ncbi:hypothetical protein 3 [Ginkgo biloba tombusvirus]|nr:hypothetical protein 3 [Ginkgo biloba tombusvirus]
MNFGPSCLQLHQVQKYLTTTRLRRVSSITLTDKHNMAKQKQKQKQKPRTRKGRGRQVAGLGAKELQLARLLNDPCSAEIPAGSIYSGETGIVSRFAVELGVGSGVAETCGAILFHPNDNTVAILSQANPATTFTINAGNFVTGNGPGTAFLLSNAAKMRSLAACITAMPVSSTLNCTGDIAVGNLTLSSVYGTNVSINSIFSLLTVRGPMVRKNYEAKFVPGAFDSRYAKIFTGSNPSSSGTDDSDTAVVVLAFRGVPAASGLLFRLTSVVEWTPIFNVGLTTSSSTNVGVKHDVVTSALSKHHGGWWHNLWDRVGSDLGGIASHLAGQVITGGAKAVAGLLL